MSDPDYVTDADIDPRPTDYWGDPVTDDDLMTRQEWWDEFAANACCPDAATAAAFLCGCRGSGQVPSDISPLLEDDE